MNGRRIRRNQMIAVQHHALVDVLGERFSER